MNKLSVLIVEDDQELLEALSDTLQLAGYEVLTASHGEQALVLLGQHEINLVISDIQMPIMDGQTLLKKIKQSNHSVPVMLMTAYGTIQQAVDAMRDGAVDYLVKPFEAEVLVSMVSNYIEVYEEVSHDLVAEDESSLELVHLAKKVSDSNATVMITGESGVGKEVLAKFIHQHSPRADKPFIAINCAAIPENMLEATLFGYEKGAYTGAYKSSPGKFELANGGTILLDEISEMELGLQAKLLRVLQEKEVERLGGNKVIELDVRVLATSNRDMWASVKKNEFREDLFYRLNVFPLHITPLKQRTNDIVPIAERLLEKYIENNCSTKVSFSNAAMAKLKSYEWPGNVRELDNVIQRCMILHSGDVIEDTDIQFELTPVMSNSSVKKDMMSDKKETLNGDLRQREWDIILNTIKDVRGSRKLTAERLGISQRTLRYKLARMRDEGISIPGSNDIEVA
ncbi:MAG: sigma-54 dependent transcriptional regulator [Gammaproteobacteria bacterium]|nr:sigma-54 dependent transcriptional regulator [Gammaproteobacteria bacterium]